MNVINVNTSIPNAAFGLTERPANIQEACDCAFDDLKKKATPGFWIANGSASYHLMHIRDEKMIHHIATRPEAKDDVYLMDVGAGNGAWGRNAVNLLADNFYQSGKRFHVISLTGEKQFENAVETNRNVTHYMFNEFQIENVDEELKERGLTLAGKVDLIVSNWTLCHLLDPLGTITRLYNLVTPQSGYLLGSDFLYCLNDRYHNPKEGESLAKLFALSSASSLFAKQWPDSSKPYDFMLQRNSENPLDLPLRYTGKIVDVKLSKYSRATQKAAECELVTSIKEDCEVDEVSQFYGERELYRKVANLNLFF